MGNPLFTFKNMANNAIDLVASQEAIKGLNELIARLEVADKNLLSSASNALLLNKNLNLINTPSGLGTSVNENAELTAQLKAQQAQIQLLEQSIIKLTAVKKQKAQTDTQEMVNQRILSQNAIAEAKSTSNLVGAYQKLDLAHKKALKSAQDIGAQYGSNSSQFNKATLGANKLGDELKKIDYNLKQNGRNVGNYGTQWNGLGNSINQITRELPAFTFSAQTGFLALSNNIPILTDEIGKLQKANKLLVAEGKPTISVFQQIASSLFSLQTLMGVGILLFTVYGKEISAFVKGLFTASKGVETFTEKKKILNEVNAKGVEDSKKEVSQLDILYKTATNVALSTEQRKKAVDKLQELYPSYFKNISDEVVMNGKAETSYLSLRDAVVASARAKAIQTKLEERQSERLDTEEAINNKIVTARKSLLEEIAKTEDEIYITAGGNAKIKDRDKYVQASSYKLKKLKEQLNDLNAKALTEDNFLLKELEKNEKKSALLETDREASKTKAKTATTKAQKEKVSLNFEEVESESKLAIAILERKKNEALSLINDPSSSLELKIKARRDFSEKSIEILDIQLKKERLLISKNYSDDLEKNRVAFANKDITQKEYDANKLYLSNKLNNELAISDISYSEKWNDLISSDNEFYKKIQSEKKEYTEKTNDLILDSEKEKFKQIAEDENKTLEVRQKAFSEYLKLARKELDLQKVRELSRSKSDEETAFIERKYANLNESLNKIESPFKKAGDAFDSYIRKISSGYIEKGLDSIGLSSAKMFLDFDKNGQTSFDKLIEGARTSSEAFKAVFNSVVDVAQDVFNFISNASQANFEAETTRVQAQYDIAYKFANGNAEAEAKLAEDLEKKKKEIAYREAKAKQKQAIFNIAIDTAQAIVSALPNYVLAGIIAGIGAVQIAMVSAQQIPKYFDGGVHGGGLAMINDAGGSNYVETVVTPDGKAKQYSGRNVVLDLPKGAEIFTPEQWHEQQLFEMMKSNNVSMPTIKQSNGMTAKEMDGVMSKHFAKIQINNTTFDENGMRSWSINNGNKTIRDAKRVSRTGFTV